MGMKIRAYITAASFFIMAFSAINLYSAEEIDDIELPKSADKGNYCLQCHSVLSGRLSKPVSEWKKSVHAVAGNNCNLCHGGNPAVNNKLLAKGKKYHFIGKPNNKVITAFCGRGGCHETALKQFKRGPHYRSVLRSYHPNCTDCHGTHGIQRSSRDIITDKTCSSCHPVAYSKSIIKSITEIDTGIKDISNNLEYLRSKYVDIENLQERLDKARHLFHQLVHVFSSDEINYTKKIVELEIANLNSESKSRVTMARRLDFLYLTSLILGLIIVAGVLSYVIIMYSQRR